MCKREIKIEASEWVLYLILCLKITSYITKTIAHYLQINLYPQTFKKTKSMIGCTVFPNLGLLNMEYLNEI